MGRAYLTRAIGNQSGNNREGMEMGMLIYNGTFTPAETGEDEPFYGISYNEVMRLLRKMKDGDSLVINCSE